MTKSWYWAKSTLGCVTITGFVVASLVAKYTPVAAQEAPAPQKKPVAKKADPAKKAEPARKAKPAAPAPILTSGQKLDVAALAKIIDQEINKQLAAEKMAVSPRAEDAEFLRRVYLDLVGVIPPPDKVSTFLASTDPGKRAKVIDELLADPRFATSLAEVWASLMVPRETNNRALNRAPLRKWLAEAFETNTPLDKLVHDLLTATGEQDKNGAVTYFIGNPTVDKMTDNVTRMFLGVQLQCAQCHNHPFTDYKQNEYWGMAAFFMKVRLTANPQQAAKKGVAPGITEGAFAGKGRKGGLPESAKIVPAKFLQAEQPKIPAGEPSRPVLAKWLTSAANPFFARAMVNRFWYQAFGRGLVNPVDDMHDDNPSSHPELLAALAEQFKANGFDVKYLLRAICNSEAYQRSSRPTGENGSDNALFSHRLVRVMTPEQLFDSLVVAVGNRGGGDRPRPVAGKKGLGPFTPRDNFVNFFRLDGGSDPLEYQAGIPQALRLMNSPLTNGNKEVVSQAMKDTQSPAEVVARLYLRTLSRLPTAQEVQRFTAYVGQGDPQTAYSDILWALVNSSEFATNH